MTIISIAARRQRLTAAKTNTKAGARTEPKKRARASASKPASPVVQPPESAHVKRCAARWAVSLECRLEGMSRHASARIVDLSLGGGYVDVQATYRVGNRVTIGVITGGSEITLIGRVVHSHPGIGFGFALEEDGVAESDRAALALLLENRPLAP